MNNQARHQRQLGVQPTAADAIAQPQHQAQRLEQSSPSGVIKQYSLPAIQLQPRQFDHIAGHGQIDKMRGR